MDTLERKLPIGIQTFENIRKGGFLYVDKTAILWQIINNIYHHHPELSSSQFMEPEGNQSFPIRYIFWTDYVNRFVLVKRWVRLGALSQFLK